MVFILQGSESSPITPKNDFLEILESLENQLCKVPDRSLDCPFPRRIDHLSSGELQEQISQAKGPGSERLKNLYATLKLNALKEVQVLMVNAMRRFSTPETIDLRPSITETINWIEQDNTNSSFKDYFTDKLLKEFAQYLHFRKNTSSREEFCSDSIVQTILHLQQKFFMIDPLAKTAYQDANIAEQMMLQKLLTISLKSNLQDFINGLEIESRYQDYCRANT